MWLNGIDLFIPIVDTYSVIIYYRLEKLKITGLK
jgi:hypothetical protein